MVMSSSSSHRALVFLLLHLLARLIRDIMNNQLPAIGLRAPLMLIDSTHLYNLIQSL